MDFAPLERWGGALERAQRARRLRVDLTWSAPHRDRIDVHLDLRPETMPMSGLREFARAWRQQTYEAEQLSIPRPLDPPA